MSWLDKYKEELAAISAKGKATKNKTPFDIANLVASTPANIGPSEKEVWDTYNPFQKLIYADNTNRVLDVLSRGMYATASFADEVRAQADTGEKRGQPLNFWDVDKGKAFGAAVEGIEGQSKKSFGEVNQNWENSLPEDRRKALNDAPGSAWAKGISAFIMDVGLDPTTYIGPGVVAKGVKGAGKAVGVEFKLPSAVKNTFGQLPKTAENKVASLLEEVTKLPVEKSPVAGKSNAAVRAALEARRASLNDAIKAVSGKVYHGVEPDSIPSIFKDVVTKRPNVKPVEELATTPGRAVGESAKFNAVKRLVLQRPGKFSIKINKDTLDLAGRTVPKERLNDVINHIIKKTSPEKLAKETIDLVGRSGVTHKIPLPTYIKMLETGKLPKSVIGIKELSIAKHDKLIPVGEYVAAKSAKYSKAAEPVTTKAVKALEMIEEEVVTSTKLSPKEIAAWSSKLTGIIDLKDVKYLRASDTKEIFSERIAEILARQKPLGLNTLDDVALAVAQGKVSMSAAQELYSVFGKTRSHKGASRYLKSLNDRIDKLNIPTAADLVEAAAKGNTAPVEVSSVYLDGFEEQFVSHAIAKVVQAEFVDPKNWRFKSNKGTLRTSATPGEGLGRNIEGFNKYSQYTLHKNIMSATINLLKRHEAMEGILVGGERASFVYNQYMRLLKASEDALISKGITPIVGKGKVGLPLSMHDVLSALPRKVVEDRVMNLVRHVPPTAILDAGGTVAYRMAKGLPLDSDVFDTVVNALMQDIPGNTFRSSVLKGIRAGGQAAAMSRSDVNRLAKKFMDAAPQFAAAVERNSARASIKYGQYTGALRQEAIDNLIKDTAASLGNPGNILKIVSDLKGYVERAVRAVDEPVLHGAPEQVLAEATATLDEAIPVAVVKSGLRAEKAHLEQGINPGLSRLDDAIKTVDELDLPTALTADFSEKLHMSQTVALLRNIFPHIGNKDLRPFLLSHESAAKAVSTKYAIQLARIAKTYPKDTIKEAWKNIQDGIKAVDPDTPVGAAQIEMAQAMSTIFNLSPERGVISMSGISIDAINAKMAHFGIPKMYRLEGASLQDSLMSYTRWEDVKDPLDLFSRINAAVRSAEADKLLADSIIREFGSKSLTPSHNVKIINAENSVIGKMLGGHYFPPDIANQVRALETSLRDLMSPPSTSKILRLYDSAIHSYKAGLTIYVPAHHMRNLTGDIWLGTMDGLFNPAYYQKSIRVLKSRKSNYKDFNPDVFDLGKLGDDAPVVTMTYNGKEVKLNSDNIYRLAMGKGVLTDYTVLEDLAVGASDNVLQTSVSAAIRESKLNPVKGRIHDAVTKGSEYREHYVRMAHFIYALDNAKVLKGKTLQDALESAGHAASARVRKWHPDGSDYSAFERNKLRRVILFYSWIRKAIPLVVEAAATQPGRFMMYPKAMYNMAEANGIELDSLGSPFPTDQLFPSWMRESTLGPHLGKSGGYFGLEQGVPGPDVLEQYFTSPLGTVRTVASSATPLIKLPYEVATQTSVRTGAPIGDIPGWMLDQLPYGNRINDMAGGPIGVPAKSNVGYEPQLDIPGGITLDKRGITAVNWLTGLGITDMSKPSYIRSANIEKRTKK